VSGVDLAGIDRELARFRGAADAVSANLLELDADPNRNLLDTAPLAGVTGAAWSDARAALASVWDWFARFTAFLDQATQLRGSPPARLAPDRERQLAVLLTQASIEVPSTDVPLRDRDLLQPRQAPNHCTADELLALMTGAFARARDVVVRVGAAWDELVPRVGAARARAHDLPESDDVRAASQRLDSLADLLIADPLAVQADDLAAVESTLDAISRDERERDALRGDVVVRLREARARLEKVAERATVARGAWETTRAKISRPEASPPPTVPTSLSSATNRISDLTEAGKWSEATHELDAIGTALDAIAARVDDSIHESQEILARREHLRGRLAAYRAKAHGLRLDEDDEVNAAYEQALSALHLAPADLDDATTLVTAYQRLLTPLPEPEARR
jgi:hypothetical protein